MRRTTIHVVELIILGICFLSLGMMKAEACDCDKPRLGKTALEEADAVFSGRITEVKYLDDPNQQMPMDSIPFDRYRVLLLRDFPGVPELSNASRLQTDLNLSRVSIPAMPALKSGTE